LIYVCVIKLFWLNSNFLFFSSIFLNFFAAGVVVATLMNIGKMDNSIVFVMCVLMLAFATLCQHNLIQMTTGSKTSQAEALKEINEIGET